MNKTKKRIALSSLLVVVAFTVSNGMASPKLLRCHEPSKKSDNIQCIYSVTGQKINDLNRTSKLYVNTDMLYASCAHALCDIDPNKSSIATCICPVIGTAKEMQPWKKLSVGPLFFEINHSKYNGKKLEQVAARFSLADTQKPTEFKHTTCKFDQPTPWAYCFGRQCRVYYPSRNEKALPMAICRCKIIKTNAFVIKGSLKSSNCKTPPNKVWSAATERQTENMVNVMLDTYKRFYPYILRANYSFVAGLIDNTR